MLVKDIRAVIQSAIQKESYEPCLLYWAYQPFRPMVPFTVSDDHQTTEKTV